MKKICHRKQSVIKFLKKNLWLVYGVFTHKMELDTIFTILSHLIDRSLFQGVCAQTLVYLLKWRSSGSNSEILTHEAREDPKPVFFAVAPRGFVSTLRHRRRTADPGKTNRQEVLCSRPISVWKTIPTHSRLLTGTGFIGKSTAWPPSSLPKFRVREQMANLLLLNIFPKITMSERFAFSQQKQAHRFNRTRIQRKENTREESALCGGEGAGRQYSQSSEAKQLLESVNFNFIDFIMSQVSEMTEFQRLVSKISLQRSCTEGLPVLNQRNT